MSNKLKERIAALLERNGIPFQAEVAIGGVHTDFLVATPDDRLIVIEAKQWAPTQDNINRALHQAKLYRDVIGIPGPIFVIEGLTDTRPSEGIADEKDLVELLSDVFRTRNASEPGHFKLGNVPSEIRASKRRLTSAAKREVFAAMPFSPAYDDVYFVAMAHAAACIKAACRRVDLEDFQGDIVQEIQRRIRASVAVIADLSESKPNVLYETGFAHALGIPTVHICSTALDQLPFDVRNWNTIKYGSGQTFSLRESLAKRLEAVVAGKPTK